MNEVLRFWLFMAFLGTIVGVWWVVTDLLVWRPVRRFIDRREATAQARMRLPESPIGPSVEARQPENQEGQA